MNLVDAVVDGGRIRVGSGVAEFPVPSDLDLHAGQRVRLGLRPRELMVGTENVGHDWLDIPGKVLLSERLGRHVELDVEAGSDQLIGQATVRVPGVDHPIVVQTPAEQRSRPGDDVAISAPAERIYLFDKTTGDRLR